MKTMILLILLTLSRGKAKADIETIICEGKEENYNCYKYNGHNPNMYDYSMPFSKNSTDVYEFSDAGTRNPDAPSDYESDSVGDNSNTNYDTPVFIPYSPMFFYPFEQKKE